ncbi:MAG: hypothetical protein GEU91_17910 [Rhizobiales bacterium]|nr:hypothetical protein [Hyphomicrobiales bacterium]
MIEETVHSTLSRSAGAESGISRAIARSAAPASPFGVCNYQAIVAIFKRRFKISAIAHFLDDWPESSGTGG